MGTGRFTCLYSECCNLALVLLVVDNEAYKGLFQAVCDMCFFCEGDERTDFESELELWNGFKKE